MIWCFLFLVGPRSSLRKDGNVQRYNLAIIVPLIEEFRVLRELVPGHIHHPEVDDAIYYYPLDLGGPDSQAVVVVLGDMGTTPAGQITEKILNPIQPKL